MTSSNSKVNVRRANFNFLRFSEKKTRRLSERLGLIGVVSMLVISMLTTLDVVFMRTVLNSPIPGSNELLATFFSVSVAAVLLIGLAKRETLEVNLLEGVLPRRLVDWLRVIGSGVFVAALALLGWQVMGTAISAFQRGNVTTILQLKTWPFISIIAITLITAAIVQCIAYVLTLEDVLSGRRANQSTARENHTDGQTPAGVLPTPSQARVWLVAGTIMAAIIAAIWFIQSGISVYQPLFLANSGLSTACLFLLLWVLMLLFVPLAAAVILIGLGGSAALIGVPGALKVLGTGTVELLTSPNLAALPLFLLMGGFAIISGMANDIFRLAQATFGRFRGGLAYATIGGCAGFGALTGSSMATVATIGSISLPEMIRRGYSPSLGLGSIAAGGTLGQFVPPSTAIVIYALLVQESIGALYMAVLIPAMLTILFYMGTVALTVLIKRDSAPGTDPWDGKEFRSALFAALPLFLMMGSVLGGIFFGVFTATEAASVGVVLSFFIALARGKVNRATIWAVVTDSTRSTSMLYFVLIGATILSFFIGLSGVITDLTSALSATNLSGFGVVVVIVIAFLILGCFMDAFTIMIVTAPILAPLVVGYGFDPLWWGILVIMVVELGVVTPPLGIHIFVLKTIAPDVPLSVIYKGVLPFVLADFVKIAILIAFPVLTLWLPSLMN